MSKKEEPRCCKQVVDDTGFHYFPCSRRGKVLTDGKWYCKQHSPEAVAKRGKARRAKKDAEYARDQKIWDRHLAEVAACEGVDTEQLKPGMLKELMEKDNADTPNT